MALAMASPHRDKKTGTYYYRARVPKDVVQAVKGARIKLTIGGQQADAAIGDQIKASLRTKEADEAKRRFREVEEQVHSYYRSKIGETVALSMRQIAALAGQVYMQTARVADEEPGEPTIWQAMIELTAHGTATDETKAEFFGPTVDNLLAQHGLKVDAYSRSRLLDHVAERVRDVAGLGLRRATGDFRRDETAEQFPQWTPAGEDGRSSATVTIQQLFDHWKKDHERSGGAASTTERWEPVLALAKEHFENDASRVTVRTTAEWFDELSEAGLSPKTISSVYRAALSRWMATGVSRGLINENPVQKAPSPKQKTVRARDRGYTEQEAKRVLSVALAAPDEAKGSRKLSPQAIAARRWVPWLCAYTGARVGEITQLRKQDVVQQDDVWCIRITPEAGDVKTKMARLVPLHSHLIEQGFVEFAEEARKGSLFGNAYDHVRKWLKDKKVVPKGVQPNHAWRHRFATVCRDVGVPREYRNAIQGHSDGSSSEQYGSYSPAALRVQIEKLPRISLASG